MSIKVWGIASALFIFSGVAIASSPSSKTANISSGTDKPVEVFSGSQPQKTIDRALRLAVTVDDPSHLKVSIGQEIKAGQVISDNTIERDRLLRQRQSIELQIQNLKSKPIPKPAPPASPPPLSPIPPANFAEEEAAIAQAQLKLQQARQLYESRFSDLSREDPEVKAEVEKAESALQSVLEKVKQQEQMLQSMKDLKMQQQVIEHETVRLRNLMLEQQQATAALEQAKGKLKTSFTTQQQQLQNLKIDVQLAQSNLALARTRLATAKNNRKLLEYQASLDAARRVEETNQAQQNYVRASQEYAQAMGNKDYQLAQLSFSDSAIYDKLAQISTVRSTKDGFIRKIKPWVGNNGKYSTVVVISNSSSRNASDRNSAGAGTASDATSAPTSAGTPAADE